jgi:hypothetical protein
MCRQPANRGDNTSNTSAHWLSLNRQGETEPVVPEATGAAFHLPRLTEAPTIPKRVESNPESAYLRRLGKRRRGSRPGRGRVNSQSAIFGVHFKGKICVCALLHIGAFSLAAD